MKCSYCGETSGPFHRDHVVPRSRGGPDTSKNLVMACADCNSKKGDKLASEWLGDKCPVEILKLEARVNAKLRQDFSRRDSRKTHRHPLVGKFFHSYEGRILQWQGKVVACLDDGFLVQLYEWIAGQPSDQVFVASSEIKSWKFYDSIEDWRCAYDKYELNHPLMSDRMRERAADWQRIERERSVGVYDGKAKE